MMHGQTKIKSRSTNVSLGIASSYSADESYEALKKAM